MNTETDNSLMQSSEGINRALSRNNCPQITKNGFIIPSSKYDDVRHIVEELYNAHLVEPSIVDDVYWRMKLSKAVDMIGLGRNNPLIKYTKNYSKSGDINPLVIRFLENIFDDPEATDIMRDTVRLLGLGSEPSIVQKRFNQLGDIPLPREYHIGCSVGPLTVNVMTLSATEQTRLIMNLRTIVEPW